MSKFYFYHFLIMAGFAVVLIYSLLNQKFIMVLIYAVIALPLIIVNQRKNKVKNI